MKLHTLNTKLRNSKTIPDLVAILNKEPNIANYLRQYNGIYLGDNTITTDLTDSSKKASVDLVKSNTFDAIRNIINQYQEKKQLQNNKVAQADVEERTKEQTEAARKNRI